MPNIVFKVGGLDLSNYVRVNPGEGLDLGKGDMLEPGFSDSPFYEGQTFMSLNARNKELAIPLFIHPASAPYLQDPLNQLVQQINSQLRLVTDLGLPINAEWRNAQASSSTFFSLVFGRFEPNFNFRQTEKGWLAGILHLWTLPYGHTATERSLGTYSATGCAMQINPASMIAGAAGFPAASIAGDVSPQFDIRITTGSYLADDGRVGIFAALPQASYAPLIPVGSLIQTMTISGASGAYASQILQGPGNFFCWLAPASIYVGDHRVMGLVRARSAPIGLRAFGPDGSPLGPTVVASALDGWQLVDYGVLHTIPWQPTMSFAVKTYGAIAYNASGMFAPQRPQIQGSNYYYSVEYGPLVIVPVDKSVVNLDYNSYPIAIDGFDQASGALLGGQADALGNIWSGQTGLGVGSGAVLVGNSCVVPIDANGCEHTVGTTITGDFEVEAVLNLMSQATNANTAITIGRDPVLGNTRCDFAPGGQYLRLVTSSYTASLAIGNGTFALPGVYALRLVFRNGMAFANLSGPSGAFPGAASAIAASIGVATALDTGVNSGKMYFSIGGLSGTSPTIAVHAFRARTLASTGYQSRDILRLAQPYAINSRQNPSAQDIFDLQARARGAVAAPQLPPASLGAGLFCMTLPFDQGPANDILNVDVRARERFTYAR